jgi:1-acyl-sn-glycerol-3-phosphate acyltransferase
MHWVYYFGRGLIRFLVFFFGTWKVKGKENIPQEGPLLIVSNHIYIADPPMLAASISRKSVFMAKEDLWHNRWSRFWVQNFGAFPVKRDGFDRVAIRRAEYWLQQGRAVIMFPEGGRSKNAQLKQALPGAAVIAAHMNVPILPVGITGSEKLKNLWWSFLHHPTITINIGKPFNLPPAEGKSTREQRQQMIDYIMRKVSELLPPEYRGVYAAEKNTDN